MRCDRHGRLRFTYADAWRGQDAAVPLSLSMPLAASEHPHKAIHSYLWGLLPDNEIVLARWGQRFQVSPRNAFALLSHVGEDCAGAVQFVRPDRLDAVRGAGPIEVEWLTEEEIADRLQVLRQDQGAWRSSQDTGQFSLAGAQPKTAFLYRGGRFGVPAGRTPTTHILKPPLSGRPGHVENEHLCLCLARDLGLPTASSEIRRFGEEIAIVVTRYDRALTRDLAAQAAATAAALAAETAAVGNAARVAETAAGAAAAAARATFLGELAKTQPILRLHQEDLCQAMGLPPTSKYQNEGGPTARQIVHLLREHSGRAEEDVAVFVDALAFNWLIAGTDAHAKNYSLLHGGAGRVRLAPLYDLASALAYPDLDLQRVRLAMRVASKYRLRDVHGSDWLALARELNLDAEETIERIARLAAQIPELVRHIAARMVADGLDGSLVTRLGDLLAARAQTCRDALTTC